MKYCSWNNPGHNPYMGTLESAVDRVVHSPQEAAVIKHKINQRAWDDWVVIGRDYIVGAFEYHNLRNMNFGENTVCQHPDRTWWGTKQERGLVYCGESTCVVIPTVCRNLSVVDRGRIIGPPQTPPPPDVPGGTGLSTQVLEITNNLPQQQQAPVTEIPEISTLTSLVIGIVLMRVVLWKKKLFRQHSHTGYPRHNKPRS